METAVKRRSTAETVLMILALISAVVLAVNLALAMPYMKPEEKDEDPLSLDIRNPEYSPPLSGETENSEPSLPPPEANPYDRNDFQYNENNYLTCIAGDSISGIDVSYHQGEIDWAKVKASGIDFVMMRVGYRGYGESGKLVEDANFQANIRGASEAGLKIGVYFFSQALNLEEVEEEVAFLLERIEDYEITMPVVYDWEYVSDEARTANMDARTLTDCSEYFCRLVQNAGYQPMIYFNRHQAANLLYLEELTDYPFWLAAYTNRMEFPYKVDMWQYTDSGRVPGIDGPVDVDILFLYD